jgi:hypothetical protein
MLECGQDDLFDDVDGDETKGFHAILFEGFTDLDDVDRNMIDESGQDTLYSRNYPCQ